MSNTRVDPPAEWRFVPSPSGTSTGYLQTEPDGEAILNIDHPAYADESRWERAVSGVSSGMVVRVTGRIRTEGPCLHRTRPDVWEPGVQVVLEAMEFSKSLEWMTTEATSHSFAPQQNGDCADVNLAIVVPRESTLVRGSCRFSGQGVAQFAELTITVEKADAAKLNNLLVDGLVRDGVARTRKVEYAFRHVLRHHFVPSSNWGEAYQDVVIGTHYDPQTQACISSSSQPSIMAIMLEQLRAGDGMRVLEIGAGTGYNAALLADIVADGHVWTIDIDDQFCREVRENLAAAKIGKVDVVCGDGWNGYPPESPYDRIIVTASAYDVAPAWFAQLAEGGRLVLPLGSPDAPQRSVAFQKDIDRLVMDDIVHCGFMPMRGTHQHRPNAPDDPAPDWLYPGQPFDSPTTLVAYPRDAAPPLRKGEVLVPRQWFDYVVTWG